MPSLRPSLQVVGRDRKRHGSARERDRDRGTELDPLGVLDCDGELEERVVGRLGRERAVVARRFERRGARAHLVERAADQTVDAHAGFPFVLLRGRRYRGPHERLTPAVWSGRWRFAAPWSLSPSACSAFKECPLAYRFSYLERLPEPPSPWTTKGTLVHRALELLLAAPAVRTHGRGRARRPRDGSRRARAPPRLHRPRPHPRGVGGVRRRRRAPGPPLLRARGPLHRAARSASSSSSKPTSAGSGSGV